MNVSIDIYFLAALVTVLLFIIKILKYLWRVFVKKLKDAFVKLIHDEFDELMKDNKSIKNNTPE